MAVSSDARAIIDRLVYEVESLEEKPGLVAALQSSEDLYALLDDYNWDDGFEVPRAVAEHPACDLAVAIRLYWLASADEWFGRPPPQSGHHREHYDFSTWLSGRIVAGAYQAGRLSHDEGFDSADVDGFRERELPEILWRPVVGIP